MRRLSLAVALCAAVLAVPLSAPAAGLATSPAAALDLQPSAAKIAADCPAAIAAAKAKIDAIVRLPRAKRTFSSVVLASNDVLGGAGDALAGDFLMGDVGPDKAQRDAAAACSVQFARFTSDQGARPELYAALLDARASNTARGKAQKRLLDETIIDAKRAGAALNADQRAEYLRLTARITELRRSYSQNINETRMPLRFTAAQLDGLGGDDLAAFTRDGDAYIVPATEANYLVLTTLAKDEGTRRSIYATRFNQVAAANDPIFEEVIGLRAQLAHLLGYPNWAAYVLERRMAKSQQTVDRFLADLDVKLLPQARAEAETLRALKATETGDRDAVLQVWDVNYYADRLKRTKYALDSNVVKQYYPVDKTVPAIFGVYSRLLGVTFAKRTDAKVWAPNVQAFAVSDTSTGRYLGDLYLDLFPREGKNAHFHSNTFWRHRTNADGTIRPALNAIVGEFPAAAPGKPALLGQSDVETFFHEFGHSIAALVKASPYGLDFTWDFVEAPSQMLENWVWDPQIIKQISSNVVTGAPMPDDLIAKLRESRIVDRSALSWTRQIALATADMTYHEADTASQPNVTWARVYSGTTPLAFPDDIHFEANFNHIVGSGYSAGYYGYLWSKVYAQDMFSRFAREGLLNPSTGAAYRAILSNAGLDDAAVQVAGFVGHSLDPNPFYATLGVGGTTPK